MNKRELVKAVAAESGFTGVEAARAANAMLRVIAQSLQRGERVSVPGFGAFSVRDRKGRTGHNPATGKAIRIEAKRVVKFKPGKALQFDAAPGRIEIRPERRPPLIESILLTGRPSPAPAGISGGRRKSYGKYEKTHLSAAHWPQP